VLQPLLLKSLRDLTGKLFRGSGKFPEKNREFEPRLRAAPATIEKTPPAHAKHREKCNKAALRPEIPKSLVPRATTASNVSFGSPKTDFKEPIIDVRVPATADINDRERQVRYVPNPDIL
jgi:hypothetical protein